MGLVMMPMILLPRPVFRLFVQLWSSGNAFLLRWVAGIKVEVRGREFIPAEPAIIACKHQSEWETHIFLHLVHDPVYVMKKELRYIPAYGLYAMKMGMLFIDRGGRSKTLRKLVSGAKNALANRRTVVIFPEGTRSMPGKKLRYRVGIAALYSDLNKLVYPVAHNSGHYWPKKSFRKYAGTIVIEFLPPIPAGLDRREFMARLENSIESAADRLYAEALKARPIGSEGGDEQETPSES